VVRRLLEQGCRDFFVSTWWEAGELGFLPPQSLAVLHGFGCNDSPVEGVRPVLISPEQVARWKESGHAEEPCDLMVDTGMSRLGLRPDQLSMAEGLSLHTVHSHLACADEDHPLNDQQLETFRTIREHLPAERYSLANSAGIFLGPDYGFDLVRPGLALYGGVPRAEARGDIQQVVRPEAQVLQLRTVEAGESVGYNATFVADRTIRVAVVNIGYADGYWRSLASSGSARFEGAELPIIGRISMDLITLDATDTPSLREGEWVEFAFDLERQSADNGMSQYELLTGLSRRWQRTWS
jgi:alanine racemase